MRSHRFLDMPSLGVADKGAHLPSRATVFLFLGVRAYRSDLLRTRYVRYLSERYRVVVFLREQEELGDLRKEYYQSEHVTYIVCSEPQSRFWLLFDVFLRNELIRRFDGNPAVRWRNTRVRDRRRLFLRRLSRFLPTRLLTPSFFFFLERHLFPGYRAFRRYAREYRPALILTATPGLAPFDLYAILCAKRAGIPSVAVNMGLDNLTIYPRHVRPVDYLIVWNRMNKEQALRWHGFREEQVFISGAVRFDHYFISSPREMTREAFLQSKGLDPNRKTVLYAAKTYGTFYKNFIRRFVEWQNTDPRFASLNLFVRVHPIDSLADFEEFFGIPNVHIERASATLRQPDFMKGHKVEMDEEDLINTKDTIRHTEVCVTLTSTFTVEAFVFDKPVVTSDVADGSTGGLGFFHNQPYLVHRAVRIAHTYDDIREHLIAYLDNPSLDREGRRRVLEEMLWPADGFSYRRSVDFLGEILRLERARHSR